MDQGTAYGKPQPSFDARLTRVGAGTPMGEFLRRYWHPVGLSGDASATPKKVRALGEDLILFRDLDGHPGLLYPRCMHRGTSLYYGKVEARGIRCCHHGWLFDATGRCLEQPCEPNGGDKRGNIRQPWYPVEERYGLVFAYMGPPEKKPLLPRYDVLDELGAGESLEADDSSIGSGGPAIVPCNWLQHFESVMDPHHVSVLHGAFSGPQFAEQVTQLPSVSWDWTRRGMRSVEVRNLEGGRRFRRVTEAVLPTLRVVPSPRVGTYGRVESIGWVLPLDDASYRIYVAGRVHEPGQLGRMRAKFNERYWWELTEEEHRELPGDYEAQVGQGAVTFHSEEHLRLSDKGVAQLRRMLEAQLEVVAAGGEPLGVTHDPAREMVRLEAGNFLDE